MDGMDDEIVFEGGDDEGGIIIAKEIAAASARLDKELDFTFDKNQLHSIDLGPSEHLQYDSDNDYDDDDDDDVSGHGELRNSLAAAEQALQNELNSAELENNMPTTSNATYQYQDDNDDDGLNAELQHLKSSRMSLQTSPIYVSDDSSLHSTPSHISDDDSSHRSSTAYFGDLMASNAINEDIGQQIIHDQLPHIDEFKTTIGYKIRTSMRIGRPDPPSRGRRGQYAPLAGLEPEEQDSRLSQLPSVEEIKSRPLIATQQQLHGSIDPEDPISPSERSARLSLVPSAEQLRRAVRKRRQQEGLHKRRLVIFSCSFLLVGIAIALLVTMIGREKNNKSRLEAVQTFLVEHGVSQYDDLFWTQQQQTQTLSPQYKAAVWIANHDGARARISLEHSFLDRYVLAVLYYALGGDVNWPDSLNFLSADHVCTWYKEYTNGFGETDTMGVHGCKNVDGVMVPVGISLAFHGLSGKLPDEIRYLDKTIALLVNHNPVLGGSIPTSIQPMTDLRKLSLEHCSLYGSIPTWFGDLTKLTHLALGDNGLTGTIPTSIQQLQQLKYLSLDDNFLAGDLETFRPLSNLRYLYLDDNRIEGSLTSSLLDSWSNMVELDLSENLISSLLPESIFSHSKLEIVDLHGNRLSGPLPKMLDEGNFQLKFLALHENEFTGSISSFLSELQSLRHLDLSKNMFTGYLPTEVASMFNLQSIFIGQNDFENQEFPSDWTSLTDLRELSLTKMGLIGDIPNSIAYLSSLVYLDLSRNELTGSLPDTIGFMSDLSFLALRDNGLSGELPDELGRLSKLDVLLLEANHLSGTANKLCSEANSFNATIFGTDCGGTSPMVECLCCQICCDGASSCNEDFGSANLNPTREASYERDRYDFGFGNVVFTEP